MARPARLQAAKHWLKSYGGRDVVRGYARWFGVDRVCAVLELRELGIAVPDERLDHEMRLAEQRADERRARRLAREEAEREQQVHDELELEERWFHFGF